MSPDNFLDHAREIEKLASQVQVMIAGPGATPKVARHTQTHLLDQDPVSAAQTIDRNHSAMPGLTDSERDQASGHQQG